MSVPGKRSIELPLKNVTLVILTRNEQETIARVLETSKRYVGDILIVDGHSTDRTREIAESAGVRVILDHGRGKGDGIRVGFEHAHSEIIVLMDADESHDPSDIPRLVQPILDGKTDMVIGSRFKGGSDELVGTWNQLLRITGSNIITTFINYRWGIRLTDTQNGFRALRREAAIRLPLTVDGFPIETQMDMEMLRHRYHIIDVPAHEYQRKHGSSKVVLHRIWLHYPWILCKYLVKPKYARGEQK